MSKTRLLIALTLMLAACHRSPEARNESETDEAIINAVEEESAVPANNGSAPFVPGATKAPSPADTAIPVEFHGRWALVKGDCGPDASVAKGLMVIDGRRLRFYESVAVPSVVTYPTPARMEGRFRFSGEGQDWSKDMALSLHSDGRTLMRTEREPTEKFQYHKCAG